jgi:hypothetical protein
VAVQQEARGLQGASGGEEARIQVCGRVDGEGVWVGGHDRFEMLVVGVEGCGGDGAGFEGFLDRGGDADDWDDGYHAVWGMLRRRLQDGAVGLDVFVADRRGFGHFAIFIGDVQWFTGLKRNDSGVFVSTRPALPIIPSTSEAELTCPKYTAPTRRVSSSLLRKVQTIHDRCKGQDLEQYSWPQPHVSVQWT